MAAILSNGLLDCSRDLVEEFSPAVNNSSLYVYMDPDYPSFKKTKHLLGRSE
jgi:hypothetical protein